MSPDETALVLTKCASYDRRTIGRADVAAWHEAIGDLDLQPCLGAVAVHHSHSTDWCKPAHLRHLVDTADRRDPARRPLREAIAENVIPFNERANRRGLAAAREALAGRELEAGR